MKVLVVSFNDADNLAIENVLYELVNRGHQITIFVVYDDRNALRMFRDLKAEIRKISELNEDLVKDYDIAFCSNMMMDHMKLFDIYCFVYTSYLDNTFVTDGADFLFMSRELQVEDMEYKCASMVVGIPKNDKIREINTVKSNRILFVDSGHIPFGRQGKVEIADTILDICKNFPQYEICIKPRWLREGAVHYTHKNLEHIYDVIEERCNNILPDNLNMLTEHYDLQELIDSSITVITLFSATHLDVIQRARGLLILSGWHNEDKYDLRNDTILKRQGNLYKESGCVIYYRDAIKYLPYGLQASSNYKKMMLPYNGGASKRIVDVMEYVFLKFLSMHKFPKRKKYKYEFFKEEILGDATITIDSLKRERISAVLQQKCHMQRVKLIAPINFNEYYKYIKKEADSILISKSNIESLFRSANSLCHQILIDNDANLMGDAIDQSFLLKAFYDTGDESRIMELRVEEILCKGPYFYYLAMICRKREEFKEAVLYFTRYLEEMLSRNYDKYPQESNWGIRDAYNCIFRFYDGTNISDVLFAKIYCYLYENNLECLVAFGNRKRIYNYIPSIAAALRSNDLELSYKLLTLYVRHEFIYKTAPISRRISELEEYKKRLNRSLSCRIGFGITWLPRKTRKVFKDIKQKGIVVIWKDNVKKCKENIKKQHIYQIATTFFHKVLRGFDIYEKVIREYGGNAELILSAEATGDAYIYGMMFESYVKKNCSDKVPVYGVFGKSSIAVAGFFGIKDSISLNKEEFHYLYNLLMFTPKNMICVETMHYHVFYRHIGILNYLEGIHQFNYFTQVMAYLGVNNRNELKKPSFFYDNDYLDKIFKNVKCIQNRTVVIAPYAKTVKPIPMFFWIQLVQRLEQDGFCVCTNSIGESEPPICGTTAVFVPYDHSVPFVERAGAVIGLRSGFMDVISSAKCLKISLCNENNYKRGICHISDSFSLSAMYEEPKQYDLLYSAETAMDLVERLVNMVSSELNSEEHDGRKVQYE